MSGASGKTLDETDKLPWVRGLKTMYYLRTQSATHVAMSTVLSRHHNAVETQMGEPSTNTTAAAIPATDVQLCSIDTADCESYE